MGTLAVSIILIIVGWATLSSVIALLLPKSRRRSTFFKNPSFYLFFATLVYFGYFYHSEILHLLEQHLFYLPKTPIENEFFRIFGDLFQLVAFSLLSLEIYLSKIYIFTILAAFGSARLLNAIFLFVVPRHSPKRLIFFFAVLVGYLYLEQIQTFLRGYFVWYRNIDPGFPQTGFIPPPETHVLYFLWVALVFIFGLSVLIGYGLVWLALFLGRIHLLPIPLALAATPIIYWLIRPVINRVAWPLTKRSWSVLSPFIRHLASFLPGRAPEEKEYVSVLTDQLDLPASEGGPAMAPKSNSDAPVPFNLPSPAEVAKAANNPLASYILQAKITRYKTQVDKQIELMKSVTEGTNAAIELHKKQKELRGIGDTLKLQQAQREQEIARLQRQEKEELAEHEISLLDKQLKAKELAKKMEQLSEKRRPHSPAEEEGRKLFEKVFAGRAKDDTFEALIKFFEKEPNTVQIIEDLQADYREQEFE